MEETSFSNKFGTVQKDRVTYYRGKGMISGGSEEDVPLRHVTSVRYETERRWLVGIVIVLIGLAIALGGGSVGAFIGGALVIAIGALALMGAPTVVVSTAGGDKEVMKGIPWKKSEAQDFVSALKKQLFAETEAK